MTKDDLKYFQSMPLEIKVAMTKTRIREWVTHFGVSGSYVSFSGGKDSTVLLHLVRELYPDMPAVFVNTGLEYPEIQSYARSFENVTVLRPKMPFNEVISLYGYPLISKEISRKVYEAKRAELNGNNNSYAHQQFNGVYVSKNGKTNAYDITKYKPLLSVDFMLSHKCCDVMKKSPAHKYEKSEERTPLVATMACESKLREQLWLKNGCNAFDTTVPKSQPMSFWTENDVLQYAKQNNIKLCSVYGDIVSKNTQLSFDGIFDDTQLCTTGCDRTGCIFCGFGAHLDEYSRFLRLRETHPKQYRYCMEGGEHDINGIWKPNNKGLGMFHVIDKLNELYSKNGKAFIDC